MKGHWYVVIALVIVLMTTFVAAAKTIGRSGRSRRKEPLTRHEQAMYNRLRQSMPDLIVLAQVSFGALLTAKSYAIRNTFDRKIADFVICDKAFQVLAVIELDDSSHKGKEAQDAKRDEMLKQAGYRVMRYKRIPDIEQARKDFASLTCGADTVTPVHAYNK